MTTHDASDIGGIPTYLQELFLGIVNGSIMEDVDGYMMHDTEAVTAGGQRRTLEWLYCQLWNCTDVLPKATCGVLGLAVGSTYADAVRTELLRVDDLRVNQQELAGHPEGP